jgi:hypothetical protein
MRSYSVFLLLFLCVLSSCKTKNEFYQVEYIDIADYLLFNECLIEKGTTIKLDKNILLLYNKGRKYKYNCFYKKDKLSIVNDDMVIHFSLKGESDESILLTTKWLPKDYMINWKEEYMKYKEEGVTIKLTKVKN